MVRDGERERRQREGETGKRLGARDDRLREREKGKTDEDKARESESGRARKQEREREREDRCRERGDSRNKGLGHREIKSAGKIQACK